MVVDFLDDRVRGLRVFEWGSGGSTLWFAQRATSVISIEHNPEWFTSVLAACTANEHRNVTLCHVLLGLPYWSACAYHPTDFVLIDGRHRKACAEHLRYLTHQPAAILWDDSQRPYYQCSMHFDGYAHRDFVDDEHPRTSTLFVKLDGPLQHWLN